MNNKLYSQLAAGLLLLGACSAASAFEWLPSLNSNVNVQPPKWDWQLKSPVALNADPSIKIYDIDMFDNETNGVVDMLKSNGKHVICYVNVGAWEDYRDDDLDFPRSILGNVYDRFPNEKWLDIRDVNPLKSTTGMALASILEARFDRAKQMGCDAVEPDNMDGFDESSHNPSGFPLTFEDQIFFNLWVSKEVRSRGMAVGFKNNTNQALDERMVEAFDFVVTESCVLFDECQYFEGFLNANKPVFLTEYLLSPEEFCPTAKDFRISAIQKRFSLDKFRSNCDDYYEQQPEPEPETNLLENGDFERGLFAWNPCGNLDSLAVSANASQGSMAGVVGPGTGCLYQEVSANQGDEFSLSCDALRSGALWSIVQLSYVDAQYNDLLTEVKRVSRSGRYANYTLNATAPTNTKYAVALLYSEDRMLVDNCVLSSTTVPEPVATNLLNNGSFESDLIGWQSCANIDGLAISANVSHRDKALELGVGARAGCLYQEVPVTMGENYEMSCDAAQQGAAWSVVQFTFLDAQYNSLRSESKRIALNSSYTTYTMRGTAPPDTRFALVLMYSEGQTLVDNCVLSNS